MRSLDLFYDTNKKGMKLIKLKFEFTSSLKEKRRRTPLLSIPNSTDN